MSVTLNRKKSRAKEDQKIYDIVSRRPYVRCYYQGEHSHPVRREMLVIREDAETITGYELREGNKVRTIRQALKNIKTYRKDRIACWGDYVRLRMTSKTFYKDANASTLERFPLMELFRSRD